MLSRMEFSVLAKQRFLLITSIIAIVSGIAAKLSLTQGELLPGLDGAFYWVQVRSIIENQALAFSDLPLVFWIQALIAKIVGNIPLAVRISDAFLPALSAIPIYLISRKFKNPFLPAVAILVVLLHPIQLYFFTGDFIKNEATIPLTFFIVLVLFNWETNSRKVSVISLAILMLLVALSHFGTAVLALMMVGFWGLLQIRKNKLGSYLRAITASVVLIACFLASLALIVPSRFERLIEFITTPSIVFQRPIFDGIINGYANSIITFTIIVSQLFVIILGVISWRYRSKIPFSQMSIIVSSLITTFILSSPLISMEWADRFTALSFVPLVTAAILIFGNLPEIIARLPIGLLAIAILCSSFFYRSHPIKQVFSEEKYAQFKQLVQQVNIPKNSIIVARHGVEYLTAWHLKTDVVLDSYFETADLTSYSAIFILVETPSGDKKIGDLKPPVNSKAEKPKLPNNLGDKPSKNGGKEINPSQLGGQYFFGNDSFTLIQIR